MLLEGETGCACGAMPGQIDEEGFCESCGKRLRRPATDHLEEALGPGLAAVSDRGLCRHKNEDRFALAAGEGYALLVVCDGVSSTFQAEKASETVAAAIAETLSRAGQSAALERQHSLSEAVVEAARQLRVQETGFGEPQDASTTVVAALVQGRKLTVAWMGDSRAYWQDDTGVRQLTRDHSWREEALAAGESTREEARNAPEAHALTRWLGADADPDWTPSWMEEELSGPGWLLLCTDGLWNYAEDLGDLDGVWRQAWTQAPEALGVARHMVSFANGKGGQDNITVAVLRVE